MNLEFVIRTPVPPHAFSLDAGSLLYARLSRQRDALERLELETLGEGWSQLGPVGLLSVDAQRLGAAVKAVVGRLDKRPVRASLVVPNAWLRSVVVDVDLLPRQRAEAEEVLRWRLKKILPCRPDEVRLDYVGGGEGGRVMVVLVLDRPVTAVEQAFAASGVQIGRLEPAVLALTPLLPDSRGASLLTVVERGALGLVLVAGGRVRLIRHKVLPSASDRAADFVVRELSRTVAHAREQEGISDTLTVHLACLDDELRPAVEAWSATEAGVGLAQLAGSDTFGVPTQGVDRVRLWTLLASAGEGVS